MLDLQSYLRGKGRNVPLKKGRLDLTSYMLGKSASGGIQKITGALPLTVRSRASQVLGNYIIYGESVQDGTPTPDNPVEVTGLGVSTVNLLPKTQDLLSGYINVIGGLSPQQGEAQERTSDYIPINPEEQYTLSAIPQFPYIGDTTLTLPWRAIAWYDVNKKFISRPSGSDTSLFTQTAPSNAYYARVSFRTFGIDVKSMFTKTGTAPTSYIPYGYELPLKVTAGGTTTDYPVYIGDSQLMAEEYVDYAEQKIYKLVDGTLTPTDPPVPLPDITLPQGEVTIDTEEEVKPQTTIKGKIEQI